MIKLKNCIFFLIYILFNPQLLPLIFKRQYLPVYVQYEWLKKYDINTIIDVGAYQGNVFGSLSILFPRAKIFAFEPNTNNFNLIKSKYHLPKLTLSNLALSNKVGKSHFIIYPLSYLSSLLEIDNRNHEFKHLNKKSKRVYIMTTTLDKYFEGQRLKGKIFLKVDTQGTEGVVLRGARKLLKEVSVVNVETSFDSFYKNQDNFEKIYKYLARLGFQYVGHMKESQFYPSFDLWTSVNSIFIK